MIRRMTRTRGKNFSVLSQDHKICRKDSNCPGNHTSLLTLHPASNGSSHLTIHHMSSKGTSNMQRRRRRVRAVSPEQKTKTSLESSGIGLKLDQLEELLCQTIQPYCRKSESSHCRRQFEGLAGREPLSRTETHEIISILLQVLESPTVTSALVSHIHSTIGQLHFSEGEIGLAIQSFTKTLWLETSCGGRNSARNVAFTMHRLAVCQARLGDNERARALFSKVVKLYKACNLKNDAPVFHAAQEELDRLHEPTPRRRSLRRKSNEGLVLKL